MELSESRLIEYLRQKTGIEDLDASTALFSDGTVDSVGMIDLIAFLETETGVEIQHDDVTLDNLDSVSRILAFLASRAG